MRSVQSVSSIAVAIAGLAQGVVLAAAPRQRPVHVGMRVDGPVPAAISRREPAMIAEADAIWRGYDVTVTPFDFFAFTDLGGSVQGLQRLWLTRTGSKAPLADPLLRGEALRAAAEKKAAE